MAIANGAGRKDLCIEARLREYSNEYDFTTLLAGVRLSDERTDERSELLGRHIGEPAPSAENGVHANLKSVYRRMVTTSAFVALVISLSVSLVVVWAVGGRTVFASDNKSGNRSIVRTDSRVAAARAQLP